MEAGEHVIAVNSKAEADEWQKRRDAGIAEERRLPQLAARRESDRELRAKLDRIVAYVQHVMRLSQSKYSDGTVLQERQYRVASTILSLAGEKVDTSTTTDEHKGAPK